VPAGGGSQLEVTFRACETERPMVGTSAKKERDSVKIPERKLASMEIVGRKESARSNSRLGFEEVKFVGLMVPFPLRGGCCQ
jgi:hypothetical protein